MKSLLAIFTAFCMSISLVGCGDTATTTPETPAGTPDADHTDGLPGTAHDAPAGDAPAGDAPAGDAPANP